MSDKQVINIRSSLNRFAPNDKALRDSVFSVMPWILSPEWRKFEIEENLPSIVRPLCLMGQNVYLPKYIDKLNKIINHALRDLIKHEFEEARKGKQKREKVHLSEYVGTNLARKAFYKAVLGNEYGDTKSKASLDRLLQLLEHFLVVADGNDNPNIQDISRITTMAETLSRDKYASEFPKLLKAKKPKTLEESFFLLEGLKDKILQQYKQKK
tara:strand:+ start:11758 stop:12393 length:636 start_codon:yes stop_codon:yes gene_type:complete